MCTAASQLCQAPHRYIVSLHQTTMPPLPYAMSARSWHLSSTPHCHMHSYQPNAYGDDEAHKPVWLLTLECMQCSI
jgi:hypothetical protein